MRRVGRGKKRIPALLGIACLQAVHPPLGVPVDPSTKPSLVRLGYPIAFPGLQAHQFTIFEHPLHMRPDEMVELITRILEATRSRHDHSVGGLVEQRQQNLVLTAEIPVDRRPGNPRTLTERSTPTTSNPRSWNRCIAVRRICSERSFALAAIAERYTTSPQHPMPIAGNPWRQAAAQEVGRTTLMPTAWTGSGHLDPGSGIGDVGDRMLQAHLEAASKLVGGAADAGTQFVHRAESSMLRIVQSSNAIEVSSSSASHALLISGRPTH